MLTRSISHVRLVLLLLALVSFGLSTTSFVPEPSRLRLVAFGLTMLTASMISW